MQLIRCAALALFLCSQPQGEAPDLTSQPQASGRDLSPQFAPEGVDVVILNSVDAGRVEGLLKAVFSQLRMHPRYSLAVQPLPGEKRPRLAFIRGRDADVALVKKALTAVDEASRLGAPEAKGPSLMRVDLGDLGAAEMRRRLVEAARRAKLLLGENDFIMYPDGAAGSLFFIGDPELSARVAEMSKGLDRPEPPDARARLKTYACRLWDETVKSFAGLFSTLLSALILVLLHLVLCRLPLMGKRYRESFKLFWEQLFASFKGQDLALEIIKAAAGFGYASSAGRFAGAARAAGGVAPKDRAMEVARKYVRWRGLDADSPEIKSLLEAAIDAEAGKTDRGPK